MLPTNSYQLYTAAERHPRDLPAAGVAAGLRDLRLRIRRVLAGGGR